MTPNAGLTSEESGKLNFFAKKSKPLNTEGFRKNCAPFSPRAEAERT